MELPVSVQAGEFGLAVLCGLCLALAYDVLRGFRRLHPAMTWALDLLWGLWLFGTMLCFLTGPARGLLRAYHGVGAVLGGTLWFRAVTPWILPCWLWFLQRMEAGIELLFRPGKKFFGFFCKFAKKCFSIGEKMG